MKLIISIICVIFAGVPTLLGQSRNTASEVTDYREVDNKIILELFVNGVKADFVLDLAGHTALLAEYIEPLNIDLSQSGKLGNDRFHHKSVPTDGTVTLNTISLGNNAYATGIPALILGDEPYLRELGVAGIINGSLFRNCVVTIDAQRKKITTSVPYRPPYIVANMREDMKTLPGMAVEMPVKIDGKSLTVVLDIWHDGTLVLTEKDFTRLELEGSGANVQLADEGYGKGSIKATQAAAVDLHFVKSDITEVTAVRNNSLSRSVVGNGILREGLLAIDYNKRKVYFQPFGIAPVKDEQIDNNVEVLHGKLNDITRDYFIEHVYDYKKSDEFIFKGDKPVVIDFWATWCGPCMRMMPEMQALAEKYKDRVLFYKVNADKEKELCSVLDVTALPTVFFIPVGGKPTIEIGATPEKYEQLIKELLLE